MQLFKFILLMIALTGAALPVAAWDGVEVTDSAGLLRQEVFAAPSPSPGYCYWDKDEPAGPSFHATDVDGYGNTGCADPWMVHCDNDSLVYQGTWPLIDGLYVISSAYRVELTCTVDVTVATLLTASRAVTGNLDIDDHALTIVFPDGTEVLLLEPGSGPDQVQLELDPGSYQVSLTVEAFQSKTTQTVIDPYESHVVLKWEDPDSVDVEHTSWGSLKAVFR